MSFASQQRIIHHRCEVTSPGLLEIHTDHMSLHDDTEIINFTEIDLYIIIYINYLCFRYTRSHYLNFKHT